MLSPRVVLEVLLILQPQQWQDQQIIFAWQPVWQWEYLLKCLLYLRVCIQILKWLHLTHIYLRNLCLSVYLCVCPRPLGLEAPKFGQHESRYYIFLFISYQSNEPKKANSSVICRVITLKCIENITILYPYKFMYFLMFYFHVLFS